MLPLVDPLCKVFRPKPSGREQLCRSQGFPEGCQRYVFWVKVAQSCQLVGGAFKLVKSRFDQVSFISVLISGYSHIGDTPRTELPTQIQPLLHPILTVCTVKEPEWAKSNTETTGANGRAQLIHRFERKGAPFLDRPAVGIYSRVDV